MSDPGPDRAAVTVRRALAVSRRPPDVEPFGAGAVESSIPERLAWVAARHSDSVAVDDGDREVTYGELGRRVGAVERGVAAVDGCGPGEPVAVLASHSVEQVVAILGVFAAGRAAIVVDPEAPHAVIGSVLADGRPALVVYGSGQEHLARTVAPTLTRRSIGAMDGPPVEISVAPDDLALLAYTSGTTGSPKAARMSHRALLQVVRGAAEALAIAPSDRLPMLFPLSLAVAAYPMLLPLLCGARLCLFDLRGRGLAPFAGWLRSEGVTVVYLSPTVARFMGEGGDADAFAALRLVVLGGERVDGEAVEIVRRRFGAHVEVANGYGSTETGVLTFAFLDDGDGDGGFDGAIPVGWPIPGMDLLVLGPDGRPVDLGETGELHVRSRYLFDGYHGQPEASARVLRRDGDGAATYLTGDLARLDATGCLHLVGRGDTEVKVRGHRVVPGEVEQALLALDLVKDAVVDARPDPSGSNLLVAWVVPAEADPPVTEPDVRSRLSQTVAPPLVPRHIQLLDRLPVLPNGKLDRRALPEPGNRRPLPSSSFVEPGEEHERSLARLWEQVLEVHPVGAQDDFFELGGTSLDAARMLVLLEEDRGAYVPMSTLLGARTVAALAATLSPSARSTRPTSAVQVQRGDPAVPPLFFVHDLYGTAWVLQPLAPLLGADQPLWGFESPLLAGPESPFSSLEAMAARYVSDLRGVQPEGPYHLAGYSFGGVLAFEMARQLVAAGQPVRFLGVVDVGPGYRGRHFDPRKVLDKPPMWVPGPLEPEASWGRRLRFVRELAEDDVREAALHVLLITGLDRWVDPVLFRLDLRRTGQIHPRHRTWYAWRGHWGLARSYRWSGRTYPGDLTLFWAAESASADATMGWGGVVTGDLDIVRVDARHETMMQAGTVERLAAPLRAALEAARHGDRP